MNPVIEPTRKRGRPKTSNRKDVSVKIDHVIASRAHYVAKFKGISIAELLSDMLEQPITRAFREVGKDL